MTKFTELHWLRAFERRGLEEFFERFAPELKEGGIELPAHTLPDDEYLRGLGRVLLSTEGVPETLHEVLHAVCEMATPEGHAALKKAIRQHGLTVTWDKRATRAEIALRVWLVAPALLARKSNEQQFGRVGRFDNYEAVPGAQSRTETHTERGDQAALARRLDAWCAENDRGEETVVVERYDLNGEVLYLIRHGDTCRRTAKVEGRRLEILHYRPAKDDLVGYCPARDRLRINAKTCGERELYRRAFGILLHGREDCFRPLEHSLSPLQALGREALECQDVPGLRAVQLTRLEVDLSNGRKQLVMLKGDDVFQDVPMLGDPMGGIPASARVTRAGFSLSVNGFDKPMELVITPPNTLRLCRHTASRLAHEWMEKRRFQVRTARASGPKAEDRR